MVHQILFPGLSIIIIGLLASHITMEVDYEFLFSLSEHLSHLNRARTIAEVFESFWKASDGKVPIVQDLLLPF